MKAVEILKKSWQDLIEDYEQNAFNPKSERDIQCYLYHLCIENGLVAKEINADERFDASGEGRSYTDLVIGSHKGSRLYVELKWIRVTEGGIVSDRRMNRITQDIVKSARKESRRKRYLLVMLHKYGVDQRLLTDHIPPTERDRLRKMENEAKSKGVNLMFSAIRHE